MKRLVFLALFAFAAWYGWKHKDEILHRQPSDEAVIENQSGHEMTRVRLTVDGQTLVKESIPDGQKGVMPFRVQNDSGFELVWQYADMAGERNWRGGMVPKGPMLQRHVFTVDAEHAVLYRAENK